MKSKRTRIILVSILSVVCLCMFAVLFFTFHKQQNRSATHAEYGQIYLYGETHAQESILEKELELWYSYYHNENMRHLFVELPYYTAQFLNLWMQAEDDRILDEVFADCEGTAIHAECVRNFYKQIKETCPDTVFHGTDVGHQYDTTGARYLQYIESQNPKNAVEYELTLKAIEQGKTYYEKDDTVYRENKMVENFIREYANLGNQSIMGIYGSAHTGTEATAMGTYFTPCMANQLKNTYGNNLHTEDLSLLANHTEPISTEIITVNGKEYEASYYGIFDLSSILPDYQYREFWQLNNAYEDFKDYSTKSNVLPYNNYPFTVNTGQVFMIRYTKADGSTYTEYHRSDGDTWQGTPCTKEIRVK